MLQPRAALPLLFLLLTACGSSITDSTAPGPVAPGLLKDAQLENQQRLAGEDVRVTPLYKTPLEAIGVGFNAIFIAPIGNFFDYITHDNAEYAAKKMANKNSPDQQREGMLRLTDFEFARHGVYVEGYAIEARSAPDFTVRAAGIRALNRCRAKGYTSLFLDALASDEPLIQLEAADALGNIPDPQSVHALVARLQDGTVNVDVRVSCAEALRNFHTSESMNALVSVLDDTNFGVAWQARQSLELLTGQDFRYDSKLWLNYISAMGGSAS
jgi:hypothetical protein